MPIVRIEKQKLSLANSQDPNTIAEYEFPIDLNWEFPRAQLELGQNLGEGKNIFFIYYDSKSIHVKYYL